LTARRYGSLGSGESFTSATRHLGDVCRDLIDQYVADNVLRPLQEAIAIK
jgi:hypothetical protein